MVIIALIPTIRLMLIAKCIFNKFALVLVAIFLIFQGNRGA